jgi:hypothetical protein
MDDSVVRQIIDPVALTEVVRRALQQPFARIAEWHIRPVGHAALSEVTGGVFRLTGRVHDGSATLPWSLILKIVHPPAHADGLLGGFLGRSNDPTHYNYWQREPLIYQTDLLSDLPGAMAAPRCFGITEQPNERAWLWLEDISDQHGGQWPLARYGLAAWHLGSFNGAYLAGQHPLPTAPWLTAQMARKWAAGVDTVATSLCDRLQRPAAWQHPIVRQRLPCDWTETILEFWDLRERYLSAIEELPQTFCHHDAICPNLFARQHANGTEQTVAIDWAFAGMGVVGEDLGQLVHGSLFYRSEMAADADRLDRLAFEQYLSGLRSAGFNYDPRLVRLGYVASSAVRWGFWGMFWLYQALEETKTTRDNPREERSLEEHIEHLANIIAFTLRILNEARELV